MNDQLFCDRLQRLKQTQKKFNCRRAKFITTDAASLGSCMLNTTLFFKALPLGTIALGDARINELFPRSEVG